MSVEGGSLGIAIDDDLNATYAESVGAAEGTVEEIERPSWLPEKHTSPEAMVESYTHLERKLSEQGNELGRLRAQLREVEQREALLAREIESDPELAAFSPSLAERAVRESRDTYLDTQQKLAEQAFAAVPGLRELSAAQQNAPTNFATQVAALLDQNISDWGDFAAPIQEAQMRYPHLFVDDDPRVVAQRIAGVVERARSEQEAVANASFRPDHSAAHTLEKERAQTATGAGTRVLPPDEAKREWEAIKSSGVTEYWR